MLARMVALTLGGLLLYACESKDPQVWIKKLEDPAQAMRAVEMLETLQDPVAIKPLYEFYLKTRYPRVRGSVEIMAHLHPEHADAKLVTALFKREREQELLKQSGVTPQPQQAEAPSPPSSRAEAAPAPSSAATGTPAGSIRVVSVRSDTPVFAACRPNERLIGGGCRGDGRVVLFESYPSHFGASDTYGARWNCAGVQPPQMTISGQVEAFALCQAPLPPP